MTTQVGILTVSDTASRDASLDRSGPLIRDLLEKGSEAGAEPSSGTAFVVVKSGIVADEKHEIVRVVKEWSSDDRIDWIITTGGTGFGTRDCTPEVCLWHLTNKILTRHSTPTAPGRLIFYVMNPKTPSMYYACDIADVVGNLLDS